VLGPGFITWDWCAPIAVRFSRSPLSDCITSLFLLCYFCRRYDLGWRRGFNNSGEVLRCALFNPEKANKFANMPVFRRIVFWVGRENLPSKMNHPAMIRKADRVAGCAFVQHF